MLADISQVVESKNFKNFVIKNFTLKVNVLNENNLIKSKERVQKFGEVFTPDWMVKIMLDELPQNFFQDLNQFFLEPAAGEGAFLTEILKRKFAFADSPQKMFQALKSLFAIELQNDNLQIAKKNISQIFIEHYKIFFGNPNQFISQQINDILQNNFLQGDTLVFFKKQKDIFAENNFLSLDAVDFSNAVIISNPPYQKDLPKDSDNKTFAAPIYHKFLEESQSVAKIVLMIHPARFLFNAGATPKDFNKKFLQNKNVKVVYYQADSSKVFPNTDIKGGVAVTYFDKNKILGPIDTFTSFPELNSILKKVVLDNKNFSPLSKIMKGQMTYRLSAKAYEDFPDLPERLPNRTDTALRTNAFEIMPDIFLKEKPDDGKNYLQILGKFNNERVYRFVRREYMEDIPDYKFYKIFVPAANGSGAIGEVLSTPLVGCTQTFITVGAFDTAEEAAACIA